MSDVVSSEDVKKLCAEPNCSEEVWHDYDRCYRCYKNWTKRTTRQPMIALRKMLELQTRDELFASTLDAGHNHLQIKATESAKKRDAAMKTITKRNTDFAALLKQIKKGGLIQAATFSSNSGPSSSNDISSALTDMHVDS